MGFFDVLKTGASALAGMFRGGGNQPGSGAGTSPEPAATQAPNPYQPGGPPDPGHLVRGQNPAAAQPQGPGPAANRADHERYKDDLRAQMEKPHSQDGELSSLLGKLYRPGAQVGSGSTAAAVRHEQSTGSQVGGRDHTQKAQESIVALERWLKNNPTASPGDRAAAENVLRDTRNALGGK